MARRSRPGEWSIIFAEVPPELKARLEAQAAANQRSATGELIYVLGKYLDPLPNSSGKHGKKSEKKSRGMS